MLFNDRIIWFVKPGLRRPVSISARQRLSGDAANGDIASTNYARDYEGTLAGEEAVNGEPCGPSRAQGALEERHVRPDPVRGFEAAASWAQGGVPDGGGRSVQDGEFEYGKHAAFVRG